MKRLGITYIRYASPHNKYHIKYANMFVSPLTNIGHGPVTYLDVL